MIGPALALAGWLFSEASKRRKRRKASKKRKPKMARVRKITKMQLRRLVERDRAKVCSCQKGHKH